VWFGRESGAVLSFSTLHVCSNNSNHLDAFIRRFYAFSLIKSYQRPLVSYIKGFSRIQNSEKLFVSAVFMCST
jgi:hypothetical protein